MRITASEEDMVKFKPEDASLTEANMRAVLKQFKVFPRKFNDDSGEDDDDVDEDNGDDVDEDDDDVLKQFKVLPCKFNHYNGVDVD